MSTPFTLGQTFYDHANANGDPDLRGHTTDGGHVQGFTRARYAECDRYGCRAVIVIDPTDNAQVALLAQAIKPCTSSALVICGDVGCNGSRLSHALESLIADPRPPEPMGAGAVVIDSADDYWIRVSRGSDGAVWHRSGIPAETRNYALISVADVLSEGVS